MKTTRDKSKQNKMKTAEDRRVERIKESKGKRRVKKRRRSQKDLSNKVSPPAIMEGLRRPWGVDHLYYN